MFPELSVRTDWSRCAGKTTLFRMITTLLIPDSGNVTVLDITQSRIQKIRLFTGYMPGRFSLYPDLTVEENISFYATIFGTSVKKHYHLIKPFTRCLNLFTTGCPGIYPGDEAKAGAVLRLIHNLTAGA